MKFPLFSTKVNFWPEKCKIFQLFSERIYWEAQPICYNVTMCPVNQTKLAYICTFICIIYVLYICIYICKYVLYLSSFTVHIYIWLFYSRFCTKEGSLQSCRGHRLRISNVQNCYVKCTVVHCTKQYVNVQNPRVEECTCPYMREHVRRQLQFKTFQHLRRRYVPWKYKILTLWGPGVYI